MIGIQFPSPEKGGEEDDRSCEVAQNG
jgi:hypothetical protein